MGIVLAVLFGPLVWAAHLLVLYGTHAVVCATAARTAGTTGLLVLVFALATALALALVALPLVAPRRLAGHLYRRGHAEGEDQFLLSLMRWLTGLSLVAIVANGIALLMVPVC
jgi:hypothetical protein